MEYNANLIFVLNGIYFFLKWVTINLSKVFNFSVALRLKFVVVSLRINPCSVMPVQQHMVHIVRCTKNITAIRTMEKHSILAIIIEG